MSLLVDLQIHHFPKKMNSKNITGQNPEEIEKSRQQRLEIDRAARWPVGIFLGSSIVWLILGSVIAIAASVKLHDPEFLAQNAWLTFGRVRPAHLNIVAYGWLSTAGIGIGLWILSRLCRAPIRDNRSLTLAAILWNLGNAVGVWGILRGDSTAVEWLEYPTYAAPFLLASFAFVMLEAVGLIRRRPPGHIYISQWYIMAAFFGFHHCFLPPMGCWSLRRHRHQHSHLSTGGSRITHLGFGLHRSVWEPPIT